MLDCVNWYNDNEGNCYVLLYQHGDTTSTEYLSALCTKWKIYTLLFLLYTGIQPGTVHV